MWGATSYCLVMFPSPSLPSLKSPLPPTLVLCHSSPEMPSWTELGSSPQVLPPAFILWWMLVWWQARTLSPHCQLSRTWSSWPTRGDALSFFSLSLVFFIFYMEKSKLFWKSFYHVHRYYNLHKLFFCVSMRRYLWRKKLKRLSTVQGNLLWLLLYY